MAALIPLAHVTDVDAHLQSNLLYMKADSINQHLIKMILGPFFQHCRSIYLLSRSEALIDMVPKSDDLIEDVLSLSGTQEYRSRTFQVSICLAQSKIPPSFIADYATALVSPIVPDTMSSKYLLANRDWIEFRVRRNSTTSQSTYPTIDVDEKADNVSDITSLDPDAEVLQGLDVETPSESDGGEPPEQGEESEQIEEVVTPKSTDLKTPVRDQTETISSIDETKDDTVVKKKQTQTPKLTLTPKQPSFIPTVATPASPWHQPTTPTHTGHTPPEIPTPLRGSPITPPKHPPTPRDPYILDPIKRTATVKDPSFKYTHIDPEFKLKLTGQPQPPKRKSSELLTIRNPEYTPSKKYYPLSIPTFGQEDPAKFQFTKTGKDPPVNPPKPKKPDTLDLLTQAMSELDTTELRTFIGALITIDKNREGRSDHIPSPPDLDQVRDPHMGGKVGVAGGRGAPQHDPDDERFDLGNPNNPTSTPNNPLGNAPTTLISDNSANPGHLQNYPELQTSFQAMSEGFLKAALKEGVLRQDTPKLHEFSGKPEDGKVSWRRWERQIKGLIGSYSDRAIKEAMNKALQGDAATVADSMDDDCTWQELLAALKAKFTVVSSLDVMMGNLYGIKQGSNSVSQFAINIEKVLGSIRISHPTTFSSRESLRHLRNRFFHGLNDKLRNSLRHKYETDCSYEELLQYARMVESEKNESSMSETAPTKAAKVKASSAQQQQQQQPKPPIQPEGPGDLVRLERAYRSCQGELAKMQKHLQQMQEVKNTWDASAFQSSTETTPQQTGGSGGNSNLSSPPPNQNSSPQNSGQYPNQNYNSNGRGYRGRGGRGRGYTPGRRPVPTPPGKPEGWNRLCFWCRDFATFDEANHPIKQCPYYKEVRKEWWQHQQQTSPSTPSSNTSQNSSPEGNQ